MSEVADLSPLLRLMSDDPARAAGRPVGRRFTQLVDAMERARARYAVCGAVAMGAHGVRRFTEDIDVLVHRDDLDLVLAKLAPLFREVGREPPGTSPAQVKLTPRRGGMPVDVDLMTPVDAAEAWALDTAMRARAFGRKVDIVTAEALVILKLRAYLDDPESPRGAQHRADAMAMTAAVPVDRALLRRFVAKTPPLAAELERAFAAPPARGRGR